MRRVLLFSATTGYQLRSFDEAARRSGIELVLATDRCHALEDPWQDRALPVRFYEVESSVETILTRCAQVPVSGVLAVGDRPVVLAARAAAALGLPGHPPDAVGRARDKRAGRAAFAAAGLPGPWFFAVEAETSPEAAADHPSLRFPCVLKPTGLSGSRGVIRADTPSAFAAALARIRRLLARPEIRAARRENPAEAGDPEVVLVEGFVPGAEVAVEGVLTAGRLQVLAIFEKPDPLDGPFFEETIYLVPPRLPGAQLRAVSEAVQRATAALGLRHGPIHAECRLTAAGVVLLEVAPRPIGGLCARVLRFVDGEEVRGEEEDGEEEDESATRWTLEDLLLRHAVGEDVGGWQRERRPAAVMMVPIPGRGVLRRVDGEAAAAAVQGIEEVRITATVGQLLEPLPEAGSYLGFIFARAATPAAAAAALDEAHRHLTFVITAPLDVVR